jgi:hypothetical protein
MDISEGRFVQFNLKGNVVTGKIEKLVGSRVRVLIENADGSGHSLKRWVEVRNILAGVNDLTLPPGWVEFQTTEGHRKTEVCLFFRHCSFFSVFFLAYWFNSSTNVTTWDKPNLLLAPQPQPPAPAPQQAPSPQLTPVPAPAPQQAPSPQLTGISQHNQTLLPGWVEHHSADGRLYWYNATTHVTTWDKPLAVHSSSTSWSPSEAVIGTAGGGGGAGAIDSASTNPSLPSGWVEYRTPERHRK